MSHWSSIWQPVKSIRRTLFNKCFLIDGVPYRCRPSLPGTLKFVHVDDETRTLEIDEVSCLVNPVGISLKYTEGKTEHEMRPFEFVTIRDLHDTGSRVIELDIGPCGGLMYPVNKKASLERKKIVLAAGKKGVKVTTTGTTDQCCKRFRILGHKYREFKAAITYIKDKIACANERELDSILVAIDTVDSIVSDNRTGKHEVPCAVPFTVSYI